MFGPNGSHPLQAPAVDCLFVQLAEGNGAGQPVPPRADSSPPVGPTSAGWPDPPADLENVPELREAYQWLQGERRRLEEYTRSQFAAIQQRHQAILAQHFRNEENLAIRTQELNRRFIAAMRRPYAAGVNRRRPLRRSRAVPRRAPARRACRLRWCRLRQYPDSGRDPFPHPTDGRRL